MKNVLVCCLDKRGNLKTSHWALGNQSEHFSQFIQVILKIIDKLEDNENNCKLQPYSIYNQIFPSFNKNVYMKFDRQIIKSVLTKG